MTTSPRSPAQLRRDLAEILADLPRVLAQDLTAEERREYERAGRRARLRLFWLSRPLQPGVVSVLLRNMHRRAMVAWALDVPKAQQFAAEYLTEPLPAPRCQGCRGPHGDVGPCPYAEELYGDETPCNCCDECRRACAEDV